MAAFEVNHLKVVQDSIYGRVFGVGEFKYAMGNFKGSKAVAMATKFRQNKAKLYRFQFCIKYLELFCMNIRVLEFCKLKYNYTIGIFKGAKGVAMATKFR